MSDFESTGFKLCRGLTWFSCSVSVNISGEDSKLRVHIISFTRFIFCEELSGNSSAVASISPRSCDSGPSLRGVNDYPNKPSR